ncbi:lipase esterase [Colletotrichum sojae]|uniref:Lipase esterase n=1 Tax=Colletotrichum sojae TaxID=2175907 RepID=A0A8H6MXY3_9PEZI|nr:lipase esterase [Colletotrichum sojae]
MVPYFKQKPDYVAIPADFHPLPKYGHLSENLPAWAAAEAAVDAMYAPSRTLPSYAACRELFGDPDAVMPPGGPDRYRAVTTELIRFPARDGYEVELKVYKSPDVKPDAVLMYRMHGGGWVVGRHEVDGAENVYAATNKNIVVVSVDYRLAPENPFPCGLHDSYDGLLWCKQNATRLGINPEKIIISGSSAGGNLAACLTLECREKSTTGILAQVLHFPITSHPKLFPKEQYEFGSYVQNRDNPVINLLQMESVWDAYVGTDPGRDQRHSPLLAGSLEGLPPTLLQCAGCDVLRDDGFAYAEALQAAGVDVEAHGYAGLPHCFPAVVPNVDQTAVFYERYNKFLRKHAGGEGSQ